MTFYSFFSDKVSNPFTFLFFVVTVTGSQFLVPSFVADATFGVFQTWFMAERLCSLSQKLGHKFLDAQEKKKKKNKQLMQV